MWKNLSHLILLSIFGGFISFSYQNLGTYYPQKGATNHGVLLNKYGQWSIVIGASEGLGAAWADLLCSEGFNVITVARRKDVLQQGAEDLMTKYNNKCQVKPFTLDLTSNDVIPKIHDILKRYNVGLMVYNAAYFRKSSFLDSLDDEISTIRVNVESLTKAVYKFGHAVQLHNRHTSGLIIMSSTLGDKGSALVSSYSASKAYNTVLAQSLENEFKNIGMDVLACVAGPIETPNFRRANGNETAHIDFMIQQPHEVASKCLQALGQGKYSIGY